MTRRTIQQTVHFIYPFVLPGYGPKLPAGSYRVDIDEEPISGLSFQAFLRKQVTLYLPPSLSPRGSSESLSFAPQELWHALAKDRNTRRAAKVRRLRQARRKALDQVALERAENEGMLPPAPES
ncbi:MULTISPECIES: hypothetical protein [Kordiimonas]|jgi:hypothetical protein|uniref:hypothetical protein n=1 Tax=Kordiimonas TaxID=288021 RepID=UPI0025794612|nr:hypothetical protein [Kordiimonas sp. UBA4487]